MPKYLLLMTEMPNVLQAAFSETVFNYTEHLKYMGITRICGGTVVLNDLEEFGRYEADEKSISRQLARSQMS